MWSESSKFDLLEVTDLYGSNQSSVGCKFIVILNSNANCLKEENTGEALLRRDNAYDILKTRFFTK